MAVTVLDLDVTKRCNLRCVYCFKSDNVKPGGARMSLDTALTAIDWLIAASYSAKELWVNLIGGEPLLEFPLIQRIVPYGKHKAAAHEKTIQFGCTTNLTLINDEIAAFWRQWGMGWHCSIDGGPEVQDRQRPGVGGRKSSDRAERGARYVLRDRPGAFARATVTPATVGRLLDSVLYFERLGFSAMGFALADENQWTDEDLAEWDRQLALIRAHARDDWYRRSIDREFSAFDQLIRACLSNIQTEHQCGAGRGTVLIDENGNMWPCHRWDGSDLDSGGAGAWQLGNIFTDGFKHRMHLSMLDRDRWAAYKPQCARCSLRRICAGGCPAANLVNTGSVYTQDDTSCKAGRIAYKHAMLLHDQLFDEKNELFMRKFYGQDYRRPSSFTAAAQTP
jgi:uncharacterized protein